MATNLNDSLTKKYIGLELWVIVAICLGVVCIVILVVSLWFTFRKKKRTNSTLPVSQRSKVSEEIKEIGVDQNSANNGGFLSLNDKFSDKDSEKVLIQLENGDDSSQSGSFTHVDKDGVGSQLGEEGATGTASAYRPSSHPLTAPSPLSGLPEFSHLGWGHWFTLRDLQVATNRFSKDNIIGDGGYGVVYQGHLTNGTPVAVKKLLNNPDFRVEVEAIGHVRHKNLVRLLGYCIEGTQRLLVYEYVNNGNLEQWLHGAMRQHGYLTWEARMKILLGTAKALAYLHEAIEPKVVHRDIKSSNILIDDNFEAKISDFGLAKLLGAGKSHITTRVMGTFGRPENEVNLVEWLKMMVARRRSEEVVDPMIETRPSTSALKRALLTALRCVDPDSEKRPKMSQVVRMLESEEYPIPREDRRHRRSQAGVTETKSLKENSDTDRKDNPDSKTDGQQSHRA
ncbi:hypothetical protein GH714_007881 [Hevea brasiliensis]|uniref:non-specific serine/threonine protein kinase n=1 Tax=Hevea brasiliensis TaxID=3981 RepID=A0A6A6MBQ8_HEVBR|nr:hypothetical protein GH714_007881 [Hevea brasiliensis]